MLDPTSGQCNQVHTMFCDSGYQNSYQEMLALFGPPIVDTVAPAVTIESPSDGEVFDYNEDFDLIVTLDDDRRPQIMDTSILFDGEQAAMATLLNATHTFPVAGGDPPAGHGLPDGEHTIEIVSLDEAGNEASDSVTITIQNSPVGGTSDSGSDAGTGGSSSDGSSDGSAGSSDGGSDGSAGGTDSAGQDMSTDKGCGCTTDSATPHPAWLLLGLVFWRRRRNAQKSRPGTPVPGPLHASFLDC